MRYTNSYYITLHISKIDSDGKTIFVYGSDVHPKQKSILESRQLIPERRSHLSAKNVKMTMFLNANCDKL